MFSLSSGLLTHLPVAGDTSPPRKHSLRNERICGEARRLRRVLTDTTGVHLLNHPVPHSHHGPLFKIHFHNFSAL